MELFDKHDCSHTCYVNFDVIYKLIKFKKYQDAIDICMQIGNSQSLYILGKMYYEGLGVKRDYNKAVYYFKKSAKMKNIESLFMLGICSYYGRGTSINYEIAFKIFEMCFENKVDCAELFLGTCYFEGHGVERSFTKALDYLENSPYKDDPEVLYFRGLCMIRGFKLDTDRGLELLKLAADNGYAKARIDYFNNRIDILDYDTLKNFTSMPFSDKKMIIKDCLGTAALYRGHYNLGKHILDRCDINPNNRFELAARTDRNFSGSKCPKYYKDNNIYHLLSTGAKKIVVESISELSIEMLESFSNDVVIEIRPKVNLAFEVNTFYTRQECMLLLKNFERYLKYIDSLNNDRSNEIDVFMQAYCLVCIMLKYDYKSIDLNERIVDYDEFTSRNLNGSLQKGSGVCACYAETLRNFLLAKGIECINVYSSNHAFNQVRINGKWYYVDPTYDSKNIIKGLCPDFCLLSKEEFNHDIDYLCVKHLSKSSYVNIEYVFEKAKCTLEERGIYLTDLHKKLVSRYDATY